MARLGLSRWLGERIAAKPVLEPYPGWVLGAGERNGIASRARRRFWRWVPDGLEIEWLDGLRLRLPAGSETGRAIFVTGRYEPNEFSVLQKILRPGMTFVDVGANIGLYTLFAANKVGATGKVVAFEPSSREYEMLEQNIAVNALYNVRAIKRAVSNRDGEVELLVASLKNSGHNTVGKFGYATALERTESVAAERLDEIIAREGYERVDVIKMDVEGAELAALQGAMNTLRRLHPALLVEISDRTLEHQGASSREVLDLLASEGYRFYGFDEQTGLPRPLERKPRFDSENVVAVTGDAVPW